MNVDTFNLLCEASQFSFPDTEKENFIQELEAMIGFAAVIKEFGNDREYDSANDRVHVSINDLREDAAIPSYPAEKLLENTEPLFDCYVIPKLME